MGSRRRQAPIPHMSTLKEISRFNLLELIIVQHVIMPTIIGIMNPRYTLIIDDEMLIRLFQMMISFKWLGAVGTHSVHS